MCFVRCYHAAFGEQAAEGLSAHPDKCRRLRHGRRVPTWRSEMLTQLPARRVPAAGEPICSEFHGAFGTAGAAQLCCRADGLLCWWCSGGRGGSGPPPGSCGPTASRSPQRHPRSVQRDLRPLGGRRFSLFPLAAPRLSAGVSYLGCPRSVRPGQACAVIPPPAEQQGLAPARPGRWVRKAPAWWGWVLEAFPGRPEGGETLLLP